MTEIKNTHEHTAGIDYKVIPGILTNDEQSYRTQLETLSQFAPIIQVDILDAKFTPHLTIQDDVLAKYKTTAELEVQLLTQYPDEIVHAFLLPHVTTVIVPIESVQNPQMLIDSLHDQHKRCGFSINPDTEIATLNRLISFDQITVMTVTPGQQGGAFLPHVLDKISHLRQRYPQIAIEVDGGITNQTLPMTLEAGANYFISGSYIAKAPNPKHAYETLVNLAKPLT